MAKKTVEFVVQARDEQFQRTMDGVVGRFREMNAGLATMSKKWAESFKLESIAKLGGLAMAGINATDIALKALTGNIQDAAEAAKSLPLGVGQMATALESVVGRMSGITAETARINQQMAMQNRITELGNQMLETRKKLLDSLTARSAATNDAIRLIGLKSPARDYEQERQTAARSVAEIQKQAETALATIRQQSAERMREALRGVSVSDEEVHKQAARRYGLAAMYSGNAPYAVERTRESMLEQARAQITSVIQRQQREQEQKIQEGLNKALETEARRHAATQRQILKDSVEQRMSELRKWWDKSLAGARDHLGKMAGIQKQAGRAGGTSRSGPEFVQVPGVAPREVRTVAGAVANLPVVHRPERVNPNAKLEAETSKQTTLLQKVATSLDQMLRKLDSKEILEVVGLDGTN